MTELRVGLIGCGGMGMGLGRALKEIEGARIAAVCDILEDKAAAAKEELAAEALFLDHPALLESGLVDAVIVATPNFLHAAIVLDAAAAKKHIYTEKPMALSVADCDAMIAAAKQAGVKLMVGQVLRYIGHFSKVREVVQSGRLGKPWSVDIARVHDWSARQSWRMNRAECGGILYEVSAHELDYIACLLGEPISVYAQARHQINREVDFDDDVLAIYRFQDGGMASLHASFASKIDRYHGKVLCENGAIFYGHAGGEVLISENGGAPEPLDCAGVPDALQRELREFVEAAVNDTDPTIPGEAGRRVISMAQGAYLSAATGKIVSLPL